MSESMMVKGSDRIDANSAVPVASPLYYAPQPVTVSQAAPMVAQMPPTITFTVNQNHVLILAAGCLILLGFIAAMLIFGDRKR